MDVRSTSNSILVALGGNEAPVSVSAMFGDGSFNQREGRHHNRLYAGLLKPAEH